MLQLLPDDLLLEIFCKLKFIQMDIVLVNKRIFDVFKCNEWYVCKKIINSYMLLSTEHYKKIIKNLDFWFDPNVNTTIFDDTVLMNEWLYLHFELVKFLIKNGANIHKGYPSPPLLHAIFVGNLQITELLIEKGVSMDDDNILILAVSQKSLEIVEFLIKKGIIVSKNDEEALMRAILNKNTKMIDLLIKYGADIHILNNYALRCAARIDVVEVLEILVKYNVDIHRNDEHALRMAARHNCYDSVKFFIEHGGNKELALQIATDHGNDNIIEMIKNITEK
mgnify:CR=1 FL=1